MATMRHPQPTVKYDVFSVIDKICWSLLSPMVPVPLSAVVMPLALLQGANYSAGNNKIIGANTFSFETCSSSSTPHFPSR